MSSQPVTPDTSPPSLPARPPDRFQFRLKHLLAFMFASAIVASGMRLILDFLNRLPEGYLNSWSNVLLCSLAIGGLAYFFLRVPYLAVGMGRAGERWRVVQAHRRELAEWAKARRGDSTRIMNETGQPPGERKA
jgi:hypothetical protein